MKDDDYWDSPDDNEKKSFNPIIDHLTLIFCILVSIIIASIMWTVVGTYWLITWIPGLKTLRSDD